MKSDLDQAMDKANIDAILVRGSGKVDDIQLR